MTKSLVYVNPFDCRMWSFHDRLDSYISEETCRAEIDSFVKHGQLVPALGRVLHGDPTHKVELIYGARRLFVARHLNKPLLVELRDMTDQEASIAMDIENRQRADVTPYERGLSYSRWLRAALFRSQHELARALKISSSQVSRLLRLAQLPCIIVDAFSNPRDICEGWGLDLLAILDDPERRQLMLRRARAITRENPRPGAREVYRRLLAASAPGRKAKVKPHDEVVNDERGISLFRIRHHRTTLAVLLPLESVSPRRLDAIRGAVTSILKATDTDLDVPEHDLPACSFCAVAGGHDAATQ